MAAWWTERRHIVALLLVLFLAYMAITSASLRALDCLPTPIDGVRYLRSDMRVVCLVGEHAVARVIALAVLVLFTLGLPLALFVVVARTPARVLASSHMKAVWGFAYDGYATASSWASMRVLLPLSADAGGAAAAAAADSASLTEEGDTAPSPQPRASCLQRCQGCVRYLVHNLLRFQGHAMWWESVVLVRKAGIVLLAVLVTNPYLQTAGATLWLGASLWLQLRVQPYTSPWFNMCEAASLASSTALAVVSFTLLQYDLSDPAVTGRPAEAMSGLEWAITGVLATVSLGTLMLLGGTWLWLQVRQSAAPLWRWLGGCRRLW